MGRVYLEYLDGNKVWVCDNCRANGERTHLSTNDAIVSKSFQGHHGTAYLFNFVMNVYEGKKENRNLLTGLHTVVDIHCNNCLVVLGWKYLEAFEDSQKYKVGRYIVERALMDKDVDWKNST